jgi:hypothetical protein
MQAVVLLRKNLILGAAAFNILVHYPSSHAALYTITCLHLAPQLVSCAHHLTSMKCEHLSRLVLPRFYV